MPKAGRPKLRTKVQHALKDWHSSNQDSHTLSELYLFRNAQQADRGTPRQATNLILKRAIDTLQERYERDAKLLEARFMDCVAIHNLANQYNVAESTLYTMQREAIDRLTSILEISEDEASAAQKALLTQRLDAATYEKLIGVETLVEQLLERVTSLEPPWFISIEGIGGIGKTSLAHTLVRSAIDEGLVGEIGWVSARQQHLNLGGGVEAVREPALTSEALLQKLLEQLMPEYAAAGLGTEQQLRMLQAKLKDSPHLIVIDNLETVVDVESLLPTLQKLTDPTRFVLTSRASLFAQTNIFHYNVPELSEGDGFALIRQEARWSNLSELAESTDDEIRPIYGLVGGNPLALRLVVGQNHIHPLDKILEDLTTVHTEASQNLYTYIYKQAWDGLDSHSQQILKIMPLGNPHGDDIDFLAEVSGLSVGDIRMGLNHLARLNLVDARGGMNERRYSIHGLTRSFLHDHVLNWIMAGHE